MLHVTYYISELDNIICEVLDNNDKEYITNEKSVIETLKDVSRLKFNSIYESEYDNFTMFTSDNISMKIENYNEILGRIDEEIALRINKKIIDYKNKKNLPNVIRLATTTTLALTVLTGFTFYTTTALNEESIPTTAEVFESTYIHEDVIEEPEEVVKPMVIRTMSEEKIVPEEIIESTQTAVDYPEVKVTADNRIYFTGVPQTGITRNYTNYTFFYDRWIDTSRQRAVAVIWDCLGRSSNRGIATINGRYLVAVSTTFGGVGDYIDIVLSNGEVIPCIIADAKSPNDSNYTPYGHRLGGGRIDGVEWESFGAKEDIDITGWAAVGISYIQLYPGQSILNQEYELQTLDNVDLVEWSEDALEIEGEMEDIASEEVEDDIYALDTMEPTEISLDEEDIAIDVETQGQTSKPKVYVYQM